MLILLRQPGAAPRRLKVEPARILIRKVKLFDLQLEKLPHSLNELMLGVAVDLWAEILPACVPHSPRLLILACLRNKQNTAASIRVPLTSPSFISTPEPLDFSHMWDQAASQRSSDGVSTATQQRIYVSEYISMHGIRRKTRF